MPDLAARRVQLLPQQLGCLTFQHIDVMDDGSGNRGGPVTILSVVPRDDGLDLPVKVLVVMRDDFVLISARNSMPGRGGWQTRIPTSQDPCVQIFDVVHENGKGQQISALTKFQLFSSRAAGYEAFWRCGGPAPATLSWCRTAASINRPSLGGQGRIDQLPAGFCHADRGQFPFIPQALHQFLPGGRP